ncbi:MAG: helix-turn-helix transcriptional regulator [Nitrospinota bacterium]|nr:helix-turn-helix transcriptional regulator [Nitrospinota bacterium]
MTDIKDRLKEAREKAGFNQSDIAYKTGVHFNTVLNYEKGRRQPDADYLYKLVKITNCDPTWLLTGEEPERLAVTPEEKIIFESFKGLIEKDKKMVADIIKVYSERPKP